MRNWAAKQKNAPKWTTICKIHDVCLVFNSFFVFYSEAEHRKH